LRSTNTKDTKNMTTTITKQEIENTVKEVYLKVRSWSTTAPKVTIFEYHDGRLSVTTGYDHLGYIKLVDGMWNVECLTNWGSTHSTNSTLEEAITYLIKRHFNMA